MDEKIILSLIDAALKGRQESVQMAVRKLASKVRETDSALYEQLVSKLDSNPLRKVQSTSPPPVDSDSRQSLVKLDEDTSGSDEPICSPEIRKAFYQIILERKHSQALLSEGLHPTRSLIFQGPPGVGKTMSARWLAGMLDLPLVTLDLATVMSSFLGKTGSNVRSVLDYATSFPCVLLLDEFDAIGKRRDDDRELGELKRLVTVLLQAIDDWSSSSLLIAATNHGDILDPAIWRRFDMELTFELPSDQGIKEYLNKYWPDASKIKKVSISEYSGSSFSNIDRDLRLAKRKNIISKLSHLSPSDIEPFEFLDDTQSKEIFLVRSVMSQGLTSQRSIAKETGLSRPKVKKILETI